MANRDILAIGTSAGGVAALLFLAKNLTSDLPASILVTLHLSSQFRSSLDHVLSHAGVLPATFAQDGEPLRQGHIHIAPPDRHLLVEGDRVQLGTGPRENNSRPAIDPMLRSAALCCGSRSVGVVLTGTMGDGASGLWALGQSGGITVVQDPNDAAFPEMPRNALERIRPDHVVPLADLPALLIDLASRPAGNAAPVPAGTRLEVEIARGGAATMEKMDTLGRRSVLSCPDCQGVMWEIDEDDLVRFRCHVGHTYAADLMALAMDDSLRRALGSAQRAMEERVMLARKLHRQATDKGQRLLAEHWASRARESEQEMTVIRTAVQRMEAMVADDALKRAG